VASGSAFAGRFYPQYSLITSLCSAERYVFGVKLVMPRAVVGFALAALIQARVGQTLGKSVLPRNIFPLSGKAMLRLCLIGAGIGHHAESTPCSRLCSGRGGRSSGHYWEPLARACAVWPLS